MRRGDPFTQLAHRTSVSHFPRAMPQASHCAAVRQNVVTRSETPASEPTIAEASATSTPCIRAKGRVTKLRVLTLLARKRWRTAFRWLTTERSQLKPGRQRMAFRMMSAQYSSPTTAPSLREHSF